MDPTVFSSCQTEFPDETNSTVLLGCVAESLERISDASAENLRDFLLVVTGAMIFFMQTGFAVLCAGAVRIKNVQNTMLKNLLDACGAAMAFYMVGK
jgi:Ammonium Transporter Family